MKKVLFAAILLVACTFGNSATAQTKIGYFDDQSVIALFPGIQEKLDTVLNSYAKDSLQDEYEYTLKDYQVKDSIYKRDSADLSKRPKALQMATDDLNRLKYKLINWQQYQQQMMEKKQEDLLDNINVLYVALTRAEEQLYLISQIVEPNKEGNFPYTMAGYFMKFLSFNQLYEAEKTDYSFGNPLKLSESIQVIEQTNEIPYVANLLDFKEIKIAKKEALMWGSNQESAIAYGNVIHEILSYIKTKNDIDLAITKSLENGLIVFSQEETVRKTIQDILNHDDLQSFFDSENEVFNEQLIIQKEGKAIKPDRMVVTPSNEVLLLDYKTGAFSEKHQLQLEQYQYAIENMNYIVVKKALIYIGEQINIVNL